MRTKRPGLQIFRGILLAPRIVTVEASIRLGLDQHPCDIRLLSPLISALSGPALGEKVGWRRWAAVAAGFLGILIVLKPGSGVFSARAIPPLSGGAMFAVYGLLTRLAARDDSAMVSFF